MLQKTVTICLRHIWVTNNIMGYVIKQCYFVALNVLAILMPSHFVMVVSWKATNTFIWVPSVST